MLLCANLAYLSESTETFDALLCESVDLSDEEFRLGSDVRVEYESKIRIVIIIFFVLV